VGLPVLSFFPSKKERETEGYAGALKRKEKLIGLQLHRVRRLIYRI